MSPHKFQYTYPGQPFDGGNFVGLFVVGGIILLVTICACWPSIAEWFNENIRYRNNTIKSFIICQRSPNIDLKKIYRVVDDTNNFLRGITLKGVEIDRKKIKTKNLISVTSVQGQGCYYFIIWYKAKG